MLNNTKHFNWKTVLISRTDALGDIVLTLPLCGWIKKYRPDSKIIFLANSYSESLVKACHYVDQVFVLEKWDKWTVDHIKTLQIDAIIHVFPNKNIAKKSFKASIPLRIGTSHRFYHWLYCNNLLHLSRKKSNLHESQLNLLLAKGLGLSNKVSLDKIKDLYGLTPIVSIPSWINEILLKDNRFNLVLHPKSRGSAREWPVDHFVQLIQLLPKALFQIWITGSKLEGELLRKENKDLFSFSHVQDITGQLNLNELISFLNEIDGLIACSTGPLHIASALGKNTLGLYPPIKPMDPKRWGPVGQLSNYLCLDSNCSKCRDRHKNKIKLNTNNTSGADNNHCSCLNSITSEDVAKKVLLWMSQ